MQPIYNIGQRVSILDREYLIACVSNNMLIQAINMANGFRLNDGIEVAHFNEITQAEMEQICGTNFELI